MILDMMESTHPCGVAKKSNVKDISLIWMARGRLVRGWCSHLFIRYEKRVKGGRKRGEYC